MFTSAMASYTLPVGHLTLRDFEYQSESLRLVQYKKPHIPLLFGPRIYYLLFIFHIFGYFPSEQLHNVSTPTQFIKSLEAGEWQVG